MVTGYVRTSNVSNKKCPASSLLSGHDQVDDLKDGDRIVIPTIFWHNSPNLWEDSNKYDPNQFATPENMTKNELHVENNRRKQLAFAKRSDKWAQVWCKKFLE